ncbi:Fc.00g001810.m01.CDS01 [Cosmosporella sp. VM-42]
MASSNVELLAALVDFNDTDDADDGAYRFLVDGEEVKYVTIEPGVLPQDERTFAPVLIPLLPAFPPGDWNEGHVAKDRTTGEPIFSSTKKSDLPGIGNIWHDTNINHIELKTITPIRQTLHRVTHPLFPSPILAKFAQFPWEIPYFAAETTSYHWIHNRGIGPHFLGHIHEAGRVIGFLLEEIPGARTAEVGDLAACQRSLEKLHGLGVMHGDINKHNFLIKGGDGEAVLIDFETAQKCEDRGVLDEEYRRLGEELADMSGRGGAGLASDSSSD